MNVNDESGAADEARSRSQADRTERTRGQLVAAGREAFGQRGYEEVSTTDLATAAGVTRGALYHHFADKRDLFRAVYESVEAELTQRAAGALQTRGQAPTAAGAPGVAAELIAGAELFLDLTLQPEIGQIVLRDGPAVLGWSEWRRIGARYGLGVIENALARGVESGELRPVSIQPTAHALLGALDELAMWVAEADDVPAARREAGESLRLLVAALT